MILFLEIINIVTDKKLIFLLISFISLPKGGDTDVVPAKDGKSLLLAVISVAYMLL